MNYLSEIQDTISKLTDEDRKTLFDYLFTDYCSSCGQYAGRDCPECKCNCWKQTQNPLICKHEFNGFCECIKCKNVFYPGWVLEYNKRKYDKAKANSRTDD